MSKLGAIREMSQAAVESQPVTNLDMEMLHVRMSAVSQDMHDWMKNSGELLKAQRDLLMLVQRAAETVKQSAQEVRDYPASVMEAAITTIAKCASRCEDAADKAQKRFDATNEMITVTDDMIFRKIIYAAVCSSLATASLFVFVQQIL